MDKKQHGTPSTSSKSKELPEEQHSDQGFSENSEPLHWASAYASVNASTRRTRRPWATTWRLKTTQGDVWLKQLTPLLAKSINVSVHLAEMFPETVPSVIAADADRGLLLSSDHAGEALGRVPTEQERTRLLSAYASIQARSLNDHELLQALPLLSPGKLVDDLIAFLDNKIEAMNLDGVQVSAQYFLSKRRCRRYVKLLRERAPLLKNYLSEAATLPQTINHGDLRSSNAAQTESGEVLLYDWDESLAGPAGASLHGMFSGSLTVVEVLNETALFDHPEDLRQPRRELESYIQTLTQAGYAEREKLTKAIGSSTVAGMLHYLISFSRFPLDSRSYRRTIRRNLKKRISDLFSVCDWLCLQYDGDVIAHAKSYSKAGSDWRAERMLNLHLEQQPMHAQGWALLGNLLLERGRVSGAERALQRALSIDPNQPYTRADLAKSLTRRGEYIAALKHLTKSLANKEVRSIRRYQQRVNELYQISLDADKPGTVPTVKFTVDEKARGKISPESLALCDKLYRKHGVLLMKDVFDPALLKQCHNTFIERYDSYLNDARHKDALRIGDKRFQVTLDLEPPYNTPKLYGNDFIVPLMKRLVGRECILGCFVSVVSLPGSEDQRLHKDHKDLFHDDPEGKTVPSFAVTVMVPLVDLDEIVGTTRVIKGSHRLTTRESRNLPMQTPIVKLGDCYLMDYRVSHHGQANRSDLPRPIISMLYQRPWFRDYMNFKKQLPMQLKREAYKEIPKSLKQLFRWTTEPR